MNEASTAPTKRAPRPVFQPFPVPSSLIRVDVAAQSHAGRVRQNNEDQFLVAKLTRSMETMLTTLPSEDVPARADEINYLMVVADGMGGHAAGEVASRLAISAMVSLGLDIPDWFFKLDDKGVPIIERRTRELIQHVGTLLFERGRQNDALRGMGTTLTAVRSYGFDILIVHVGDSRAYLCRAGSLVRLTKDHTYAQMLVDTGRLKPSDVGRSGVRHILTNALGGATEKVQVDVDLMRLEDGDRLLLCSDGLTDLVDEDTILRTLCEIPASNDACTKLIQIALDNGGRDNITAIVATYSLPAGSENQPASIPSRG